ncbi:MAG: hypothetical protein ACTSPV_00370 [Candidatus Hodarchaeales archaeon]
MQSIVPLSADDFKEKASQPISKFELLFNLTGGKYKWIASGGGTDEYYLELLAGGDPSIDEPAGVLEDGTAMTAGAAGSLAAGEWDYGDNDTLGYNTIYVRLSDGADPDSKFNEYIEAVYNLSDLGGEDYLISADYSSGQRELTYKPIAASIRVELDDTDGDLNPKNNTGTYNDYLKVGRKIRLWTGMVSGGSDYYWQWFVGYISDIQINRPDRTIILKGFDYTQRLIDKKLKSPDNYWGSSVTKSTVKDQADYELPVECNWPYIAYLDGNPIYEGDYWVYDQATNKFWFLPSKIPDSNGTDDLVIYYYTDQVPENVVADLLVTAGLYADKASALAAMDYTATGETIEKVRFNSSVSALHAIQKICERCDYEFYFKYDGTPVFKPIPLVDSSVFTFDENLISDFSYLENIDEVKNHIIIEGDEYTIFDELRRILDGSEIQYTLDEIPDGSEYGKVKLTGIDAGLIIVAGLDAQVTDRMFTDPTAKSNIEAWRHASDTTLIDGGDIYAHSVTIDKLTIGKSPNLLKSKYSDFQSFEDGDTIGVGADFAECSTADFYIGDRCLKLAILGGNWSGIRLGASITDYNIRLKPSTKYIISCYAEKIDGSPAIRLDLKQDDGTIHNGSLQNLTASWARYSQVITTDANLTNSGLVKIDLYNAVAGTGSAYIDAVQIEEASAATNPEASPYKPSGTVEIHGGQIEAATIDTARLKVGSSANQQDTFDIYQGESDAQIFRLRSTSINHQITQGGGEGYDWGTYTDCYFYMRKFDADFGGMHCASFTESDGNISFELYAIYGTANKASNGEAQGAINLAALRADPANHGYQDSEHDDNLFVVKGKPYNGAYQALLALKESGYLLIEGSYQSFQHEDDIKLVKELEDILSGKIDKEEMKEKDVHKKHKVVHVSEANEEEIGEGGKIIKTGKKRLDRFVNIQAKDMLLMGAIRQLSEKNQNLEKRLNKLEAKA